MLVGTPLFDVAQHLAVAALAGLAIGAEREWSGHAKGPDARFAGVRTFFLLGLVGGVAGWFALEGLQLLSFALLLAGGALTAAAYSIAARRTSATIDGTTEVAALFVLAAGTVAGLGFMALASGIATVVVIALAEKTRIHSFLAKIEESELRAALLFAAIALVILPVLPNGPFGPWGGIRPRALWMIVVIFSGINFLGYLARRGVGAARGYGVTGLIGGVISSTAVTLNFSRESRRDPGIGTSLAIGVIGACTVLLPRIAITSMVLNPPVARALLPYLLPSFAVGALIVALALRRPVGAATPRETQDNPLRFGSAFRMALLFQVALTASTVAASDWGSRGVISSAVVLGLTDMDALTVSMNRLGESPDTVLLAARAIAIGVLANTFFKAALAAVLGTGRFRWLAVSGLAALAAAAGLGLWIGGAAL